MQRLRTRLFLALQQNNAKFFVGRRFLETTSNGTPAREFLTKEFQLAPIWENRFEDINKIGLGNTGSYEWIVLVQKKFASNVKASAIDVDIAITLATEIDQKNDLIDLIYKLRHSENAGDLLASTEYALFRLLLKYQDWDSIFKILNDPINYGVFMNHHIACLFLNSLLNYGNIPAAAKIATLVMQQEMFESTLLNFLSIYSLAKFLELNEEERVFDEKIHSKLVEVDDDDNEDEMKAFKYPFLKNEYFDGHFDLNEPIALVEKSMKWFTENSSQMKDITEDQKKEKPLSELVYAAFEPHLVEATKQIIEEQKKNFSEWNELRKRLIEAQAERLNLVLRLDEIVKMRKKLEEEKEILYFFENRLNWEERANANEKLFEELQLHKKEVEATEKEYAAQLFEHAKKIAQGKFKPKFAEPLKAKV